jgi:hypothetical protein
MNSFITPYMSHVLFLRQILYYYYDIKLHLFFKNKKKIKLVKPTSQPTVSFYLICLTTSALSSPSQSSLWSSRLTLKQATAKIISNEERTGERRARWFISIVNLSRLVKLGSGCGVSEGVCR